MLQPEHGMLVTNDTDPLQSLDFQFAIIVLTCSLVVSFVRSPCLCERIRSGQVGLERKIHFSQNMIGRF